jgi:signal transduction histidine kinase
MIGQNLGIIIPSDIRFEEELILSRIRKGESIDHYETRRLTKDREEIMVSLTVSPIYDGSGTVIGASKVLRDITESKMFEHTLMKAQIKAQEDERYEMGGELHDNVCQILASSMLCLEMIKNDIPDSAAGFYKRTHDYIALATEEIRNLSHRLAPAFFDDATLEFAFNQLLENFNLHSKLNTTIEFNNDAKYYPLSREIQLNLYRILQEQLRNILKHAKASNIFIGVNLDDRQLNMIVKDDGVGFDMSEKKGGIGFANMQRRVQLYKGRISIHSAVNSGCEVQVQIPV